MRILAIDPGVKGAIALYEQDNFSLACTVQSWPLTLDELRSTSLMCDKIIVEKLIPLPKDTPTTAWQLARTVGWIEYALHDDPDVIWVRPADWQAWAWKGVNHDIDTKARTNIAFHNKFPHVKDVPGYAYAAALMAMYGSLL